VAATRSRQQRTIRGALTAACALAGIQTARAEVTEFSAATLLYTEPSRVTAFEAIGQVHHEFSNGRSVMLKAVYDALTGASASGAVPSSVVQTYTRPSGLGSYQVSPGETPLDDTFHDTRFQGNVALTQPLGRVTKLTGGLNGSSEFDYLSLGGSFVLERDFNKRNTTLNLGTSYSHDTISPEGGRPVPFAEMTDPGVDPLRLDGNGSKNVLDATVGLVQILDRSTIAQFSYSLSHVDGYQTDPYKLVSVVDPVSGDPVEHLFESRPDARTKHIFYGKAKRSLGQDIVELSYRYLTDDWEVQSHTIDLNYRWMLNPDRYVQPRVRFYHPSAADFYTRWLEDGQSLPDHASADYRLGEFDAWTVGARFGQTLRSGHSVVVRVEYYIQAGDSSPPGAPGALADFDLFPKVDAWIVNVGYSAAL